MGNSKMEFPPSSLRLFLSADIVGSTAFKQAASLQDDELRQTWLEAFSAFYAGIEEHLTYEWEASLKIAGDEIKRENNKRPRFWKAAGDEVIYVLEITSQLQPLFAVTTFRRAVYQFSNIIRQKSGQLDLKATAWLAGFPINNAEIVLGGTRSIEVENPHLEGWWDDHIYRRYLFDQEPNQGEELDFIGPQMDLGFRLRERSTPRRMILSVDLVLMLVNTYKENWPKHFNVENKILFDDTESLKGVLSGTPYPLMWLDMPTRTRLNKAEDNIRGRKAPEPADVKEYCEAFIDEVGDKHGWIMEPFIKKDGEVVYGAEPDAHKAEIQRLQKRWKQIKDKILPDREPDVETQAKSTKDKAGLPTALERLKEYLERNN